MAIFVPLSHLSLSIKVTLFEFEEKPRIHSEDFVILACVVLAQYSNVTDGQTNGRTDASTMAKTREALHAVACKKFKKIQNIQQWH